MKKKIILAGLVATGLLATASQTKMFVYNSDGTKSVFDVNKVDSVCFANIPDSIPEARHRKTESVPSESSGRRPVRVPHSLPDRRNRQKGH